MEIRSDDAEIRALIAPINHRETELCVRAERAFLSLLEADCSVPVAGYATLNGDFMMFRAIYFMPNGMPARITHRGETENPEQVAREAYAKLRTIID